MVNFEGRRGIFTFAMGQAEGGRSKRTWKDVTTIAEVVILAKDNVK